MYRRANQTGKTCYNLIRFVNEEMRCRYMRKRNDHATKSTWEELNNAGNRLENIKK